MGKKYITDIVSIGDHSLDAAGMAQIDALIAGGLHSDAGYLKNLSDNSILDWTTDQGDKNIHSGNYFNTQLTSAQIAGMGYTGDQSLTHLLPKAGGSMAGDIDMLGNNIIIDSEHGFINSGAWTKTTTPYGYIKFGPANTSHAHIYTDRTNFYFNKYIQVNGGSKINTSDIRANIFYDLNDSNYFLDLNATSRLNRLQTVSTGVNKNSNQTTKDGLSLYGAYVGGEATYGMMFTGTAGSGTHGAVTSDWATYFTMNNSNNRGWIFRRVGSGNSASISAGGAATFDTSVTSDKFYDTNNTNSWLDIRDSWGNYHLKANEGGMYFDAPVYYFRELSNSSQRLTIDAGTATATSSLRAPIFYDSNDTNYYLNPASTSRLNTLNVTGNVSAGGGSSPNWNAAYSWGNHADGGYLPTSSKAADSALLDGKDHTEFGATLATYGTTAGASGRIRCTAPFRTNTGHMFQVQVSIYGSYEIHNYVVSGYMYSSINNWHAPKAIYSGTGSADIKVGRDSSGYAYISIANANYTGVRVHNMTRGYHTSVADTYDPWTIAINAGTENSLTPAVLTSWNSNNLTNNNQLSNGSNYLTTSGKAADANLLDGINSTSFLRSDAGDSFSGTLVGSAQRMMEPNDYGKGVYGKYSSTKFQHVWGMGSSWHLNASGSSLGNFYGIAYTHSNVGSGSQSGFSHQTLFVENGSVKTWIGIGVRTVGDLISDASVKAPIFYDSNNTSYYLDPASTSNLNGLNVKGGIEATGNFLINSTHSGGNITLDYFHSSDTYSGNMVMFMSEPGITHDGGGIGNNIASNSPYYGRAINHGYGVYLRFYKTNGHFEFWNTQGNAGSAGGQGTRRFYGDASGNTFSQTSSRAPIFYDSNDTSYYLDPASTSRLKTLNVTGNVSAGGGSSPNWNAAYNWGNHADGGYLAATGKAADSNTVGGLKPSRFVSGGEKRKSTQISKFADKNEVTGFYYGNNVTGAPTTDWMNYIHSAGNSWYSSNNYSFQLTHAFHSDNLWVSRTTNGVQSGARLILDSGGGTQAKSGILQSNASLRAPIFYDTNNTGYYLNPASTSKLSVLTVVGAVTASNFILSSDERKKTKIKGLTRNNINANWKSFEMKNDEGEYRTGVIAQELEEAHPEFVNTDSAGFKSVKYIDLLIAKIAELEARLEKLEK